MKIWELMTEYPKLSIAPGCVANAIMLGAQYRDFLPLPIGVAIAAVPVILFIPVGGASDETVRIAHGLGALLFIMIFVLAIAGYIGTVESAELMFLLPLGMLSFVLCSYILWKISKGEYIESSN